MIYALYAMVIVANGYWIFELGPGLAWLNVFVTGFIVGLAYSTFMEEKWKRK